MGAAQDAMDKRMEAAKADPAVKDAGKTMEQAGVKAQSQEQNTKAAQDLNKTELKTPDPVKDDRS